MMRSRPKTLLRFVAGASLSLIVLGRTGLAQEATGDAESAVPGTSPVVVEEKGYVPAALGTRTDRAGNSWNIEENGTIGRIGSTMVNSGLALLVNGEKFVSQLPLMSPGGEEIILRGRPISSLPGIRVQRQIRFLGDSGTLRYAELLYNGSTDPVTLNVSLETNFSGNYQTYLTDRGRTEPSRLEPGETGAVVLPGASQSTRAFLFVLSEGGAIEPTLSARNRYGLEFTYPVRLLPGATAIIVHNVAQVVIPQNFDRRNLQRLFRPHSFEENGDAIPDLWKSFVRNVKLGAGSDLETRKPLPVLSSLGIEPGALDTLAVGSGTRLAGEVAGGPVAVATQYGDLTAPMDEIAAISGEAADMTPRVYLRDGQVFSGTVDVPDFSFTRSDGGSEDLSIAQLDRLIFRAEKSDDTAIPLAMIETYGGDRLAVGESSNLSMVVATAWGILEIPLADLARVFPSRSGKNGSVFELKSGIRCLGYFATDVIEFTHQSLGSISLDSNQLKYLFRPSDMDVAQSEIVSGERAVFQVHGDQTLVGSLENSTISVVSGGIPVEAGIGEIRRIERIPGVSVSAAGLPEVIPSFQIERWDGGTMSGFLTIDTLSLEVMGSQWQIPLRDITRIDMPFPDLNPETVRKIGDLITSLGDPVWTVREKATRDLAALGTLARPVLRRELGIAEDPEVAHRIERILAGLD